MTQKGIFITFEGGEGAGKTTQIARAQEALKVKGHDVVRTREPGGSPEAEAIRALVLDPNLNAWDDISELLLFSAARHEHLKTTVIPALNAGKIVLCDRFVDSTRVYQGYVGGLPLSLLDAMFALTVGNYMPHLTLIFDIDPEISLKRAIDRGDVSRYENKPMDYHKKVREAFRELAEKDATRCRMLDATQTPDAIFNVVMSHVDEVLAS